MKKLLILTITLCALTAITYAQNQKTSKIIEKASQFISQNKEDKAINTLTEGIKSYPDQADLYIFLGEIYFHKKDYDNSIQYYNKGLAIDRNSDLNAYYRLGQMQKQTGDYASARRNFQYFIDNATKPQYKSRVNDSKYNIECLDFITEQTLSPKEFNPVNLGENINDKEYQYLPTLMLDNTLYFTERKDNKEDFYFASVNNTNDFALMWNKKQKLPPPLNTDANEGAASISPDGRYLYFAKCNTKDGYGSCDIYRSKREGNSWGEPENLGANVNSKDWDSQPSIASDGRTLFFASSREGGYGKSDIWYSYLKDDGTWTKAKNCGSVINTGGNEMTPYIHPSNTTLYFSSDSLIGMGGEDIYYSKLVNGKFQKPVNLGYPVNTPADETCFIASANGLFAIYSRKNDNGDFDLYAFGLEKLLQPVKVITLKGKIVYDDGKNGNESVLSIKNLRTNRLVTSTVSDKQTDMYLLALPVGEDYAMSVTCNGYLLYSENFSLQDDNTIQQESSTINKNIELKAIKEGSSVVLKNIFFATDSFELMEESNAELNSLLKLLKDNPQITIEISGFTDNVGKDEYNLTLSQKRADSVKLWLIEKGIDSGRLQSKGYGKQNPIADNSTEEGRKQNRRTEFKILKSK
ncbi:MAG: PD40 domain-containing protein [Bacteroidales bacterium]|nr:PD40 domain-containing protein [Bacteroidales bacterium]